MLHSNKGTLAGSDLFISNTRQYNESESLTSVYSVTLTRIQFENISFTSIASVMASLSIETSVFTGSSLQGIVSDALILDSPLKISIRDTSFSNFMGRSAITAFNDDSSFANLYFNKIIFKDCRATTQGSDGASVRGGFINSIGTLGLIFESCQFLRGYSVQEGGALSYDCKGSLCSLTINGTSVFQDNEAEMSGQSIFSPKSAVKLSEDSKIINKG